MYQSLRINEKGENEGDPKEEKKSSVRKLYFKRIVRGIQKGLALSGIVLTAISFLVTFE